MNLDCNFRIEEATIRNNEGPTIEEEEKIILWTGRGTNVSSRVMCVEEKLIGC